MYQIKWLFLRGSNECRRIYLPPAELPNITREEDRKIFRKINRKIFRKINRTILKISRCYKNRLILNLKIGEKFSKIGKFSRIFCQKSGKIFKNREIFGNFLPKIKNKFQNREIDWGL
jgi:hypothetical protein